MLQRRWLLLLAVLFAFAGPACGQTIEFLDAQGNSLSDRYFEGSRAYLRVVDPAVSTSVTVAVSAFRSGDAETLALAETGAGTGVFEGSIELSIAAAAPDGRLQTSRDVSSYPYAFDVLTATYGAASDAASTLGSTVELTDAAGAPLDTFVAGDTIHFRVVDVLANSTPGVDTTVVNLSALVRNFGESELPTLTETGPDTSVFEGSIATMAGIDPISLDGILELEPGDLAEVRHHDANGQTYSYDEARALSSLPVTIEWVDDAGQPLSQAYEFSNPRLRVTDGGSAGIGAVVARVTSDLRGDEEWVNLSEDFANPGVFFGSVYVPGTLSTFPPWSDGRLEVTENAGPPLQRDTIRAFLEGCSAPPCPSDAVGMIASTVRLTDSQWADVELVAPGSPVFIEVIDHWAMSFGTTTVAIVSQSGDFEIVTLDPEWTLWGTFRGSIAVASGPAVQGDGVLQVAEPDTVTVMHSDPLGLSSSEDAAAVGSGQIEFLDRSGNPVDYVLAGGDVRLRVIYPAGNVDPGAADTVTVTVRSRESTGGVRDTEPLQLFETGPATAVFTGEIPSQAYYFVMADGVLQVWATSGQNDTVEVALESTTAVATLVSSVLRITDAVGADVTNIPEGGTLHLRLESDYANDPAWQDPVQIRVVSLATGDEEYVNVLETGLDTALFEGSIATVIAASPVAGNGQLEVQPGETVRASHDTYLGAAFDLAVVGDGSPASHPPNAVDDFATTPDDTPVVIDVLANDSDPDGHAIQLFSFTQGDQGGWVSDSGGGVLTYAPPPYFTGTDTFTYRLVDEVGDEDFATVTVTVEFVNDPPSANDDAITIDEDQPVVITPTDNDHDPENQALTIVAVSPASKGTPAIYDAGLGYVSYTPYPDANGSDAFTYTIVDPQGATAMATVFVTLRPRQDPPVAVNDEAATAEDTLVSIFVRDNDSDPDGDTVWISNVTQGAHGAVGASSTFLNYQPAANYYGTDSFTYTINDGNGNYATATVTVTIAPADDPPTAAADSVSTNEDAPLTFNPLANDGDPDGDAISLTAVTQGFNGSVTVNGDGSLTYTPEPDSNGNDSFTYTIQDTTGRSATAGVSVTVVPVNDPPVAVDDAVTTSEDTPTAIFERSNDSDPDGDGLIVSGFTQGAHGAVTLESGFLRYAPAADYHGTDSFTYTVRDFDGATGTATVTVTITPVWDAPVAGGDAAATAEDTPVTVDVLANDSDVDGDSLSITAVTQGANGAVTFNAGSLTYTPSADFNGADAFTYTVTDGTGIFVTAAVAITIAAVNDPPVAVDETATTAEDTALTVNALANDGDADGDVLSITEYTLGGGANGSVTLNADKTLTYTPAPDFSTPPGTPGYILYRVSDGAAEDIGYVHIHVTPVNDPPAAQDDSALTAEDNPVWIPVLGNDSDVESQPLAVTAATQGANGVVTFSADSVTYSPAADFNGADSFSYTVGDGNGGTATATVSVNVTPENDAPLAAADTAATDEDTDLTIGVLANDSDPDGDSLSITAVTQGANGSVGFTAGSVTYAPNANFNGPDSFSYTASDGNGGTATATVSVTVGAVNDTPDAVDDSAATSEDVAAAVSVLANDADVDGEAVTLVGVTQGTRGSVTQNPDGTVTYTPSPNTFGSDTFTYTVRDAAGLIDTATVAVSVAPVNDPPDAVDDSATADEGGSVVIAVLANDVDVEGGALAVTGVSTPAHGTATINGDGTVTYTPAAAYSGPDSFTYTAGDGGATDSASVTVQIRDVLGNVAVLGTNSVWIVSGADVLSGDVVANQAGSGPFLNSTEVSIGGSATTAAGWDVQGNRVTVASGAVVASDIYYNQLSGSGTVSGTHYTPLTLPVFAALPAFPSASPGSSDISVANNGTRTLAPGSYRDLIVGRKATVTFTGGVYHFRSIRVDREAKLFFSAAGEVRVQQKMSTGNLTTIGPGAGSSATAATIVFYVAGINGTSGTLAATPKAVEAGTDNVVSANVYAPNGTLWLKDRVQATGSFLGRDVQIGANGQVSLSSAW